MRHTGLFLIILIFLIVNTASYADEVLVDIDEKGKIKYIDSELEKKLKIFPDYKKFIEARIYKIGEEKYSLEILYYDEKNIEIRKRTLLDEKGFQELRKKVTERSAKIKLKKELDQEGRYKLLTTTTIYSLALYGPMASMILALLIWRFMICLRIRLLPLSTPNLTILQLASARLAARCASKKPTWALTTKGS